MKRVANLAHKLQPEDSFQGTVLLPFVQFDCCIIIAVFLEEVNHFSPCRLHLLLQIIAHLVLLEEYRVILELL